MRARAREILLTQDQTSVVQNPGLAVFFDSGNIKEPEWPVIQKIIIITGTTTLDQTSS